MSLLPAESVVAIPGETLYFIRCECDNSTPGDRTELLLPDQFVAIYGELRNLAMANLERGEIP
jgi:hypothetical protein